LDRGELVCDTLDANGGDGRAGERAQQHAPQRVAERVAEAAVERLDHERATVLIRGLAGDAGNLEVEHRGPDFVAGSTPGTGHGAGVQRSESSYLEYSSTMS